MDQNHLENTSSRIARCAGVDWSGQAGKPVSECVFEVFTQWSQVEK